MSNNELAEKQEAIRAERRWLEFFKVHPTFRNEANRSVLQSYVDEQVLSVAGENGAEVLEIAFLACGNQLCERAVEVAPQAPAPTEDIGEPRFGDPRWTKEKLRERVRSEFVDKSKQPAALPQLPAEYTKAVLIQLHRTNKEKMQFLREKFGQDALNGRIEGRS
jgi:hypothetical protein